MKHRMDDFFHIDLARLNLLGWLLMLSTSAIFVGTVLWFLPLLDNQKNGAGGNAHIPRWIGLLMWLPASFYYLGCRWIFEKLGLNIYRRHRDEIQQKRPTRVVAAQEVIYAPSGFGEGARFLLGFSCFLIGISFIILGALYGDFFPKGAWPFYGLGAFCICISLACFSPRIRPIALRMIGLALLCWFSFAILTNPDWMDRRLELAWGAFFALTAGFMIITGRYPTWGMFGGFFHVASAKEQIRIDGSTRSEPEVDQNATRDRKSSPTS